MKLYLTIIFLLVMSFVSCTKNTGITVTKPGADLILSKMQSGNWNGVTVTGNSLGIQGSTSSDGNYTFDSPVLGLGGVYKDDTVSGNGYDYILTAPVGLDLVVVQMNQQAKDAVDAVLDILDDAGGEAVIGNLVTEIMNTGGKIDLSNADKILSNTNLPAGKYEEVKKILEASSNGFSNAETIK
ncbi:hypothetical protein R4K92_11260 [Brachyspira intermedia]|uniref:hypothetical protein n=1 Tax=Brachyspira intermedia TaxID=84377 RepID=UPI0030050665